MIAGPARPAELGRLDCCPLDEGVTCLNERSTALT